MPLIAIEAQVLSKELLLLGIALSRCDNGCCLNFYIGIGVAQVMISFIDEEAQDGSSL